MRRGIRWLPLALGVLWAAAAVAGAPEWADLAALDTIEVVTADEDGDARETTVWIAVLEGAAYVRTGSTTWGENLARNPELVLRAGEDSWPLRVEFVEDDALRQRITDAFREKYGFSDRMVSWMRGSRPKIMRLVARE